ESGRTGSDDEHLGLVDHPSASLPGDLTCGDLDGMERGMTRIAFALLFAVTGCKSSEKSSPSATPTAAPAPAAEEAKEEAAAAKPEVKDEAPDPANLLKPGAPVQKGWSDGGPGEVVWKVEGASTVTLKAEAGKPEGTLFAVYQGKQQHVT